MLLKQVNVTNPRNVLVQIPSYVVRLWRLTNTSALEVRYNETKNEITIRPSVRGRGDATEESKGMA